MIIDWKETQFKYGNSKRAYVGKVQFGFVVFNEFRSSAEIGNEYRYQINLTGLKDLKRTGTTATEAEAQVKVEQAIKTWFAACGVTP